jgi:Tol biopolymer transport system component
MDFGAGHDDRPSLARGNSVTGTPLYMAPELFTGQQASQRTDVYALGTLLFYLVTGQYPVMGRSLDEVRQAHARGERTRLRDLRADLPAAFVRVVEHTLQPDPAGRIQTAGQLEAAIEAIEWPGSPVVLPDTRRRWITGTVMAAAAVAVAGIASTWPREVAPSRAGQGTTAASAAALTARRVDPPPEVWPFSNPSDDGRFVAGMVNETGDAAIVDLVTGQFRPLGIGFSQDEGYASMGTLSPDGTVAAIDYHTERGGNLYVVRADGSRPRLLIEAPSDVAPHQWSRDGTIIVGMLERPGQPPAAALIAASDGAVRVVGEFDAAPTHMALSPDNRYIAYDAPERPGSIERDLYILDAHTGNRWLLEPSPGGDVGAFWTPDGHGLVFLSDRNRNPSLWFAPMVEGRLQGPPQLLKDGVGRVRLRGFTAAGAMHYDLSAGFAEVFLASIDDAQPPRPEPLSPHRAISNFYPRWSPDGRFVAYAAERSDLNSTRAQRELWIYDATTGTEARVPFEVPIGLPLGWSQDSSEVLVEAGGALQIVHRETGRSRVVGSRSDGRAAWGPAGILFPQQEQVVLVDARNGRTMRTLGSARDHNVSPDGQSVITKRANGRIAVIDAATGLAREWNDPVDWLGLHFTAPHTAGVAYMAGRKGVNGEVRTLMYWGGGGEPRELMRIGGKQRFVLVGWLPDDRTILAARWDDRADRLPGEPNPATLLRVSIGGGDPVNSGLTMDGLRDISIHPDGRRIAFNAGWKRGEQWVMEHLLPR